MALGAVALFLVVTEVTLSIVIANVPRSGKLGDAIRHYYAGYERRVIQLLADCSQYDTLTTYRLKPGSCRFANRGFDNVVTVGSHGYRGTESSWESPEVVVAGDSYAMGWGVPDDSTLAVQLERLSGLRTLNMGTSSWGTARELIALKQVDLSKARYLVIEYCDNDVVENEAFIRGGGRMTLRTREEFDALAAEHLRTKRYRPGQRMRRFLPVLFNTMIGRVEVDTSLRNPSQHVDAFLGVLEHSPVRLDSVRLMVTAMGHEDQLGNFRALLAERAREAGRPAWIRNMTVVTVQPEISYEERFPYDGHLRSNAYTRVAQALAAAMARDTVRQSSR